MSERDVSAGAPTDARPGAHGVRGGAGNDRAPSTLSTGASHLRAFASGGSGARRVGGVRIGLLLLALWLVLRAFRWSWPLLVAPSTDAVCRHLVALDPPSRPVSAVAGELEITHERCVGQVERRLQRRGLVGAAALRHCLGTAKSLDAAAACR